MAGQTRVTETLGNTRGGFGEKKGKSEGYTGGEAVDKWSIKRIKEK